MGQVYSYIIYVYTIWPGLLRYAKKETFNRDADFVMKSFIVNE